MDLTIHHHTRALVLYCAKAGMYVLPRTPLACTYSGLAPIVAEHGYLLYVHHHIVTGHMHCFMSLHRVVYVWLQHSTESVAVTSPTSWLLSHFVPRQPPFLLKFREEGPRWSVHVHVALPCLCPCNCTVSQYTSSWARG